MSEPTEEQRRYADFFNEAHAYLPQKKEPKSGLREAMSETGNFVHLIYTFLFDRENFELYQAVYGYDLDNANKPIPDWKKQPWDILEDLQDENHPYHNLPPQEALSVILSNTPLCIETMLDIQLLEAAAIDDTIKKRLNQVIEQADAYNQRALAEGLATIDPYLVANWLWNSSGLNPEHTEFNGSGLGHFNRDFLDGYNTTPEAIAGDFDAQLRIAVNHMGMLTQETGNPYLALAMYKGGGGNHDANGDGDFNDIADGDFKSILQQVADKKGIALEDVDLLKHLDDIRDINNTIYESVLANNSTYWDFDERERARQLMEQEGYKVSAMEKEYAPGTRPDHAMTAPGATQ